MFGLSPALWLIAAVTSPATERLVKAATSCRYELASPMWNVHVGEPLAGVCSLRLPATQPLVRETLPGQSAEVIIVLPPVVMTPLVNVNTLLTVGLALRVAPLT